MQYLQQIERSFCYICDVEKYAFKHLFASKESFGYKINFTIWIPTWKEDTCTFTKAELELQSHMKREHIKESILSF